MLDLEPNWAPIRLAQPLVFRSQGVGDVGKFETGCDLDLGSIRDQGLEILKVVSKFPKMNSLRSILNISYQSSPDVPRTIPRARDT